LEVTELKGKLMTSRIELQDKLAELTLASKDGVQKTAQNERKQP
jgi:hypothetical protein